MNVEHKSGGERDSLKLISFLKTIEKKKYVLLGTICVLMVIAGVTSLYKPKIFTVETILQIGKVEDENVEPPSQVVEKINNGIYQDHIVLQSGADTGQLPEIKVKYIDNTNFVLIHADVQDVIKGKGILGALTDVIIKEHQIIIDEKRNFFETEMIQLVRREQATESILEKGLRSPGSEAAQFFVLSSVQNKIDSLQDRINDNQKILDGISNTEVIKVPTESPVASKVLTDIILAGILGLALGIFIVLTEEWWLSYKRFNA